MGSGLDLKVFCSSSWSCNLLLCWAPQTFSCSSDTLFYLPGWCQILTLCFSLETVSLWRVCPPFFFAGALLAWLWGRGREEEGFQLHSDSLSDLGKSWGPGPWVCGLHEAFQPPEVLTLPPPLPAAESPGYRSVPPLLQISLFLLRKEGRNESVLCLSGASIPSSSNGATPVLRFLPTQAVLTLVRKDWVGPYPCETSRCLGVSVR